MPCSSGLCSSSIFRGPKPEFREIILANVGGCAFRPTSTTSGVLRVDGAMNTFKLTYATQWRVTEIVPNVLNIDLNIWTKVAESMKDLNEYFTPKKIDEVCRRPLGEE